LRIAVREGREAAVRVDGPPSPIEVVRHLAEDEAVLVVGLTPLGTIATVLRRDNEGKSPNLLLDETWPLDQWASPADLDTIVERLDRAIGPHVAESLARRPVHSLWVAPHLWMHSIPFREMRCLTTADVVRLPSMACLTEFLDRPNDLAGEAVVVGNPTADLVLSEFEAELVDSRLSDAGMSTAVHLDTTATRSTVKGCTALHVAGHGRFHRLDPQRGAVLFHHSAATSQLASSRDPLKAIATEVDRWSRVDGLTREAVIRSVDTLRETRRDDVV